jgi:hypothetical protein
MKQLLKSKRDAIFLGAAVLLFLVIAGYIAYTFRFLGMEVNAVIGEQLTDSQLITRFNFDGAQKLLQAKQAGATAP